MFIKNKILYKYIFCITLIALAIASFISLNVAKHKKEMSAGIEKMSADNKQKTHEEIEVNYNLNYEVLPNNNQESASEKINKIDQKNDEDSDVEKDNVIIEPNEGNKDLGEFIMTAYTAYCDGCIGITKTGYDVRNTIHYKGKRVVAVDPNVIDLHSQLRITMPNGEVFEAVALDTGGAIKGKRLDLLVESREKARVEVGRKRVKVELINHDERQK